MVYGKGGNRDGVVAFDHLAYEHIAVLFKHSACDFERCVEHRIENESAVGFHVQARALGRRNRFSAFDVQAWRVRVTCRNIECEVFAHCERDYGSAVFDDVVFAADFQLPRICKRKF